MASSRKHLKIGLVLDDGLDKPDGVQQYILGVGEWLRGRGHEVHYLVGQTERRDIPGIHSLSRNVQVRFNGNRMSIPLPTSRKKLRSFLASEAFDVLHVQVPYSPFMAQRLIRAAGRSTAVVGTFHIAPTGRVVTLATQALGVWLKPSLKRFDALWSVSSAAVDFAQQTFKIDTTITPNVIDYARFHNAKPFERYDDDVFTLLFFGRLVPRKGCGLLLRAVAQLMQRSDLPPFRLLICGKGPLQPELERYVADNGMTDIVTFTGFVSEEDKPSYYASADIAVFPSTGGESFGIVLLEAMASGHAAVLAGNNSGYSAVLSEKPSLLFDPRDTSGLAKIIAKYLLDKDLRQQAQTWGEAYTERFDIHTVGRQLEQEYEKALRKRLQM